MKTLNLPLSACHDLLQNVLLDAFQLQVNLLTYPYENIQKIDQGLRSLVWTDYSDDDTRFTLASGAASEYRLIIIKSNLGFYNVLAFPDKGENPAFISIGPFRDEELSPDYFTQILTDSNISPADIQKMKHIYEQMPYAQLDSVTNVSQHIISAYFPEFKSVVPEIIQYSEQNRDININTDLLDSYSAENTEEYKQNLFAFLEALKHGDTTIARNALHGFLQTAKMINSAKMREYKLSLQMINDYCHISLLNMGIHPYHVLKQAMSTRTKIENMTSMAKLEQMPNEICHKYCLLVKNYSNPDFSRITKKVIDHIQLHLDEELSLSYLASHFKKNASALSNTFSKETGTSITKYIQQTRVQEAIRLFNSTNMSVSEVAVSVGYQDFSYFSKVFSKITGQTPKEYRRRYHSRDIGR